jgi:hypothetical protein
MHFYVESLNESKNIIENLQNKIRKKENIIIMKSEEFNNLKSKINDKNKKSIGLIRKKIMLKNSNLKFRNKLL